VPIHGVARRTLTPDLPYSTDKKSPNSKTEGASQRERLTVGTVWRYLVDATQQERRHYTMPIKKETSARLVKRNITHDSISREVVQAITDPVALAIYTYLLTMPDNWTVRKKQIIDHFKPLGADAYARGMKQLRELGVVWVANVHAEDGRFAANEIIVEQTFDRSTGKPVSRETPSLGKSAPLKKNILPTEEDIGIKGWDEWVAYRAEIRKSLTPASVKKQLTFLEQHTPDQQEQIINQSITNGWTGLFEVKQNGQNRSNGKAHPQRGPKVTTYQDLLDAGHVIDG
jgi:hypothetical protein